ncbi:signal-transducing adaptor protein 1-like [Xyrichtys novacula]|uniref:Signal-transducing adaptor protein 1-like n=1 Tax=Xyrichtys novacula TaxID=13765 RepID=A0AAV1FCH7_XYRNO|nr:signal-transducing adaptor protein 1-like [Xyrichtys novacula]
MSVNPRVVHKRRETITALPLYYSGHLQRKNSNEQDFKKFFGELRGTTLFLYEDDTQHTYSEKMNLEKLKSMELVGHYQQKVPSTFNLNLHTEKVQLKMDNLDKGMEWRGYILTVIKKEVPSKLLPGQRLLLEEVLAQEKKRVHPGHRPPLPPRPDFLCAASPSPKHPKDEPDHKASTMPECFFKVSRDEAEKMLEANPEYGSIILRPSTRANNYALTLRQLTASGTAMKNFRVTPAKTGFVIELDKPVTLSSLNDVISYFLKKTEYRLQPYRASQPYDTSIDVPPAPKCINISPPLPKTVPKAQVAPMKRTETKPEESDYVVPDDCAPEYLDLNQSKSQFDGELREALKSRRANIYAANEKEELSIYQNQASSKSQSVAVQWDKDSSAA